MLLVKTRMFMIENLRLIINYWVLRNEKRSGVHRRTNRALSKLFFYCIKSCFIV